MIRLYAISGSGIGAGKTTLATKIAEETWSLAGALRKELRRIYPQVDWFNKSQAYKAQPFPWDLSKAFPAAALGDPKLKTNRGVMIRYGQMRCAEDPIYWPRLLVQDLKSRLNLADGVRTFAVDDVRKVVEIEYLKEHFPALVHLHMDTGSAVTEVEFDNDALRQRADYCVSWER